MSRYVTIQTQIRDRNLLVRVLDEMKVAYKESQIRKACSIRVQRGHAVVDFRQNEAGCFAVRAMEEQVAEHREFLNAIQRSYAREKVVDLARKAGFSVTSERRTAEQEIVLEMTKW